MTDVKELDFTINTNGIKSELIGLDKFFNANLGDVTQVWQDRFQLVTVVNAVGIRRSGS